MKDISLVIKDLRKKHWNKTTIAKELKRLGYGEIPILLQMASFGKEKDWSAKQGGR